MGLCERLYLRRLPAISDTLWQSLFYLLAAIHQLDGGAHKEQQAASPGHIGYLCQGIRKRVKTTFSQMNEHFARRIHAMTSRGFELKVFLTIPAYSILG